ncbi:MAG: NMD3-related protein [Patescibacteria group bacterium]
MNNKPIQKSARKGREPAPREYFVRPKESRRETEEFGPGKTDIVFCSDCGLAYYNKSWHHNLRSHKNVEKARRVAFQLCPACQMARRKQHEGEIRISGLPSSRQKEIVHILSVLAEKIREKDPLDRILEIKSDAKEFTVYTSENQMAQKLAKKLHEIYKKDFSRPVAHRGKGGDLLVASMQYLK